MSVASLEAALRWLALGGAVALGASVGSFLNVVIARVPAGLSMVRPRSRCPRCLSPIAWYDNLPVLSWLLLRARCRGCGAPIALRYPLVECLGAAAAAAAVLRHGPAPAALGELAAVGLLVALAFIDLDTWLLPHALTGPLIVLGLALAALGLGPAPSLASAALGASLGFATFGTLSYVAERVLEREALGFGDVFLLCGLGAWLGVGALVPVVLLASLQGALVGLALILLGRSQPGPAEPAGAAGDAADGVDGEGGSPPPAEASGEDADTPGQAPGDDWVPPRHALPFGPFLVLAALQWLYLGGALARWAPALSLFR